MDVNNEEDTGLQEENAFFNVTYMRVFGFKSFGLWLVHFSMREMVHFASMEMRNENSDDIAIFFVLFNEMLEKVSGIKITNSTQDASSVMAGANNKAVRTVYGNEFCQDRVHGRHFYFKQQIQKKRKKCPLT